MPAEISWKSRGDSFWSFASSPSTTANSSLSAVSTPATLPAISYSTPLCMSSVTSPPSSRIMLGPPPSGQRTACSVHHQYSSSDSPFHANTGTPVAAMAAAAWSWVEKMLQLAQRTTAPSAVSVSMSTAVWMVMWSEPVMRAPASGLAAPYSSRQAMRPGISTSASSISLRPHSASERSATLKSVNVPDAAGPRDSILVMSGPPVAGAHCTPSGGTHRASPSCSRRPARITG